MDELLKQLNAATERIDTLIKAAEDGKRAMTDDEHAEFKKLSTESDGIREKLAALREQEALKQAHAKRKEAMASTPAFNPPRPQIDEPAKVRILSKPYTRKLRAFSNPEDAYTAGMHTLAAVHAMARDGIGDAGAWAQRWCKDRGVQLAVAHNEGTNIHGGYLVHETMEAAITKLREEYGVARRTFGVKSMPSDVYSFPREKGSHTVYYPGENAEITLSNMTWEQVTLTAKKAAALAKFSKELNEDAVVSVADELAENMAWKFAYAEDQAGFIGDATSTYGGMTGIFTKIDDASGVTYAGSIYEALAGNTTFGTLDLVDFEGAVGKLPLYAARNAKWYISNAGFWASMARLIDAAGGNTGAMLAGGAPKMFLGFEVEIVQVANSTLTAQASTVLALLGDLTQCCYFGDRRGTTVETSADRYFEYDQIGVKATERFAVTCVPGDPSAPTTAAGPVIALKTPAQ